MKQNLYLDHVIAFVSKKSWVLEAREESAPKSLWNMPPCVVSPPTTTQELLMCELWGTRDKLYIGGTCVLRRQNKDWARVLPLTTLLTVVAAHKAQLAAANARRADETFLEYQPEWEWLIRRAALISGDMCLTDIKHHLQKYMIAWPANYNRDKSPAVLAMDAAILAAWKEYGYGPHAKQLELQETANVG